MSLIRFVRSSSDRAAARRLRQIIREHNYLRFGRDPDGDDDPEMDGRTLCAFARPPPSSTFDR